MFERRNAVVNNLTY